MTTATVALVSLAVIAGLATLFVFRTEHDAVTVLSAVLLLLFVLPAFIVVPGLGAVGSPALLLGLVAATLWLMAKAVPASGLDRGWQPMRVALFAYAAVMMASYANGQMRALSELERSGSARAVILLIALLGVALLVADGVDTRRRLDTLLRRLVLAAGFMAAIGAIQFFSGFDPTPYFQLPGLELNRSLVGVSSRADFHRPWATTQHPIEFGVVAGALVPLALHYALTTPAGARRAFQWVLVLLLAIAVPMSLSRSGVVAVLVSAFVLALAWSWRMRLNLLAWAVAFTAATWALVPGLIGTLRSLFRALGTDPSITARRDRIPLVVEYVVEHPWLGHGFGTFSVEEYLLVDNEIFVTTISTGIVGLGAFLGLILVGVFTALHVRRLTADDTTRQLAQAITAGLVALMVCLYTFDAFHYRIFMTVLFLLLGAAGALMRITRQARVDGQRPPSLPGSTGRTRADEDVRHAVN